MEKVMLKAEVRTGTRKTAVKELRKKDLIPAVVYKGGKDALNLQITTGDLDDVLHTKAGENVIITLKISGKESMKDKTVIIKEIQRDPIKSKILHVDLNEISLTETLKVNVPLATHGEPVGVKKDGGILEHVMWELQIECLPTAIPEKLEVDVSNLNIGEAVYVKNIVVPEGVKILNDPELIAMIVKPPRVEVPKEEVPEEAAEPELIRKKKRRKRPKEKKCLRKRKNNLRKPKKKKNNEVHSRPW